MVHPVLILRPLVLRLFALTSIANLHHFFISALSFTIQRPLTALFYAILLLLMGISCLLYAHFFGNTTRAQNEG